MIQYSYKHILRVQVITRFRLTYIAHSQTKSEYAYTTGTPGEPLSTVNYAYGNSDWKDLLTEYNGTAINYDLSGNPLNWRNASSLTWDGRRLSGMTLADGTELAFEYNSEGLRTGKTVGTDKTVEYLLDGTKIIREIRTVNGTVTETLLYYYNTDGDVIGLNYNGTDYYYGRNIQGDILYIYNTSGEVVTTYAYDAWGSIVSQTGTLSSTVGEANPFRYRGYYLDSETGLYYLQSRYYDATVGRFLNADILIDRRSISGSNLYIYCTNNPVCKVDSNGYLSNAIRLNPSVIATLSGVLSSLMASLSTSIAAIKTAIASSWFLPVCIAATVVAVGGIAYLVSRVKTYRISASEIISAIISLINKNGHDPKDLNKYTVYVIYLNGTTDVVYVGITKRDLQRKAQHKKRFPVSKYTMIPIATGLDRRCARALEQTIISAYTLDTLVNMINSISPKKWNEFKKEFKQMCGLIESFFDQE